MNPTLEKQVPTSDPPTLHLGITMAGAVSAGAYTAGVIDYLFEALQKWEEEKKKETNLPAAEKTVPPHQAKIEVFGGASAGGITAALAALACFCGLQPVTDAEAAKSNDFKPENNLLFDAWVNLAGGPKIPEAIFRMLKTTDIRKAKGIPSLLNSRTIDDVASDAIKHATSVPREDWPSFIAEDVEILMTLCSLRGIPVGIDFNSDNSSWSTRPSHQMSIHKQYVRFAPEHQIKERDRAIPFDLSDRRSLKRLLEFAKATAAFPIGLQARELSLSRNHIKHQFNTFYEFGEKALDMIFESSAVPDPFEFTSVDGGALNNEPFGEIASIMQERGIKDFALILVDPFPNFGETEGKYKSQMFLQDLVFSIVGALRNQGMLKEADLREFGRNREVRASYKKNMIYPTRRTYNPKTLDWDKMDNSMACGGIGGFSGLLCRDFRVHDYFLGRRNCRNFLHSYFTIEYKTGADVQPEDNHPIFRDWTAEMKTRFRVKWRDEPKRGVIHLPIIPMLELIRENEKIEAAMQGKSDNEIKAALVANANKTMLPFPSISNKELNRLRFPLAWRLLVMTHQLMGTINFWLRWPLRVLMFFLLPFLFGYFAVRVVSGVRQNLRDNDLLKRKKE